MKLHVLTGLPRSGSTLLCNVLNQNPEFHASSTSPICGLLRTISEASSVSIEIKEELNREPKTTEERLLSGVRAFTEEWYKPYTDKIIFDKGRGWSLNNLMFNDVFPGGQFIVMVRDLRSVFASVEKQHRKNAMLDLMQAKTIRDRMSILFDAKGLIGGPVFGVMDLINRKLPNVTFVQYETFAAQTAMVMDRIYEDIKEKPFKHDFKKVKNTATDPDGHYLNKFPHKGEGKIEPVDSDEWKQYFTDDIGKVIINNFPDYNRYFGYK